MVCGVVVAASAAAPGDVPSKPDTAVQQKIDRVQGSRITQEQRESAAARMKLQKGMARLSAGVSGQALVAPLASLVPSQGGIPDYFGSTPNWAWSPPLRKFVDTMPGLGASNANNLGQYISVAKPDTTTYPGSDYYEIELRQFTEQMHSDMPPTTLRGYVQVNKGTDSAGNNTLVPDPIHYLGPFITADKDKPVRIKFTNKLPTGERGDLFIPVDTSVMGAGEGPIPGEMYTQNRGLLHLHGGITPWISDGTPHQWITPAGENTPYPKGVSVKNVPDMPDPGPGSMTFFYSNQQSARLMFYHDHSFGITRLNVYAGEAAGYAITDPTEQALIANGTIPADQIPVVVQDKTFVDENTILTTDPTWNWGTGAADANGIRPPKTGDLWVPHVYVPAQNPADIGGMNATGRWHYGPWFWPPIPASALAHPPIANEYYDPINAPWEPPLRPATPNPSMGMEAYHDTLLVNGTAYPVLEVDPKSYRLRILNAADDRFFNLQMYVADPAVTTSDGRKNTEVKMVPAVLTAGYPELWPTDSREGGAPDPLTAGPEWIQIATESGFLPKPAIIPQQPVTWNADPTTFNMGNVQDHSLMVAPAERADVIVDFSAYAGKTLILYNDAPTAFPALDARTDYFTGMPDMTDTGGPAGTDAGFGSNTRTVMQIKVAAAPPAQPFDLAALEAAFASDNVRPGVFESGQNPIHVPDSRYNSAYNDTFTADPYVRIYQNEMTFQSLEDSTVVMPLGPKAIQDETSEVWDYEYGRMSGKIGVEMPFTNATNANFVLYGYSDPVVEYLQDSMTPLSPIGADGTQIWKITHNGVDTHPIHFHLFDVQLINRVGWDNAIRPPDDNELGWKDTVRISPLEDTIVALKPVAPKMNFGIPDSVRLLNPTLPEGSSMGFSNIDPLTGQNYPVGSEITNVPTNFGWEYVWHCHILSHEEMDMMRPMSLAVARSEPETPVLSSPSNEADLGGTIVLNWTDGTPAGDPASVGNPANEVGFRIERATVSQAGVESTYTVLATVMANQTTYQDTTTVAGRAYRYYVYAFNAATAGVASNPWTISPVAFVDFFTVTPIAGVGGTISPSTVQTVAPGADSPVFTITPEPGFSLVDVTIDGVSVGTATTHQFFNLDADHILQAVFAKDTFIIAPSAGAHGNISPNWDQVVDRGTDSPTFTFSPNVGYHVADVLVDGVSVGVVPPYAFTNVQMDHTIRVVFEINVYTITPTATTGGTITPSTVQMVTHGANSAVFSIAPNAGYKYTDLVVDGVSVGTPAQYSFTNVKANHTIAATFIPIPIYTITPTATLGGTITPSTQQSVSDGLNSPLFNIVPAPGYYLSDVVVDGVSMGPITAYTFTNVRANHTIAATFILKDVSRQSGSAITNAMYAAGYMFPSWVGVKDVVIASGGTSTDAMFEAATAAGLAGGYGCPLLLVSPTSLSTSIRNTLIAMPDGIRVHVVGGTGGVSNSVLNAIRATPGVSWADRIYGSDRYATAVAVATRMKAIMGPAFPTTVLITSAESSNKLADSVVASVVSARLGYPILYVKKSSVPLVTQAALFDLGLSTRYALGGTSTISETVRSAVGVPSGNRISGATGADTAALFGQMALTQGWLPGSHFGAVATAAEGNWAGPYLAMRGGPLLFVSRTYVPAGTAWYLTNNKTRILKGYVFGPTSSVAESTRMSLLNLIQ